MYSNYLSQTKIQFCSINFPRTSEALAAAV